MRALKGALGVFATVILVTGLNASPASAYAVDYFPYKNTEACFEPEHPFPPYCAAAAQGWITWGQRTAVMDVVIKHNVEQNYGVAKAYITAFAGSAQIDNVILYNYHTGYKRYDDVVIGDPNLRGGINRIRTQVCWEITDPLNPHKYCSQQWNDIRD